jgi:putative oxidoreductase
MNPRILPVLARILVACVFVVLGAERLLAAGGWLSGRTPIGTGGIVFSVFELLAGLAIMAGWQAGKLALVMAAFLLVDAFASHPFWNYSGGQQQGQLLHFLKNFSSIGALLILSCPEHMTASQPKP